MQLKRELEELEKLKKELKELEELEELEDNLCKSAVKNNSVPSVVKTKKVDFKF